MDIYAHQIYYSEVNVCRARRTTVITKGSTYATCARARNYRSREAYFSARVLFFRARTICSYNIYNS